MAENKQTKMEAARAKIKQMQTDKQILRYLVIDSENVHSTAVRDPLGTKYIYVKPGMYDDVVKISNIDFVQAIYAENGIDVKKHISHLDGKETEVLYIASADILKLTKMQVKFLDDTAPDYHGYRSNSDYRRRSVDMVNKLIHKGQSK